MRRFWLSAAVATLLGLAPAAAGADVDAAWEAYRAGQYAHALKALKPPADAGDARAAYYMGSLHADGLAVRRDYRAAAAWFRRAAEQGHGDAQFTLGFLYQYGAGEGEAAIAADPKEAARWFARAAEAGNTGAAYELGRMYLGGHGVPADEAAALR